MSTMFNLFKFTWVFAGKITLDMSCTPYDNGQRNGVTWPQNTTIWTNNSSANQQHLTVSPGWGDGVLLLVHHRIDPAHGHRPNRATIFQILRPRYHHRKDHNPQLKFLGRAGEHHQRNGRIRLVYLSYPPLDQVSVLLVRKITRPTCITDGKISKFDVSFMGPPQKSF